MYSTELINNFEITDYIETYASSYIDKGLVEDYFFGCKAVLKEEFITKLISEEANHQKHEILENKYIEYPIETMPPLIVENGVILDGNHRFRVLKKLNIEKVKIYEVIF